MATMVPSILVYSTAVELAKKNVQVSTVCCWCHLYDEDTVHVLFGCSFARGLWNEVGLQQLVTVKPNDTVMEVLQRTFQNGSKEQCALVGILCWGLWLRRNKWLWEKINKSIFGVRSMVLTMFTEWKKSKEVMKKSAGVVQGTESRWVKPPPGWIKVNVDAACKRGEGSVKVGCVARNEHGQFVRARSNALQGRSQPREAEALSLKEALSWTKQWRRNKVIFESDAKLLVEAVNGTRGKSYFGMIAEDCSDLLKHFDEVLLVFVHRSANHVVHLLAKAACSRSGLQE